MSLSETLTIPQDIYDAIVAHAREGKPEEVCGLLRGREGQVMGMHRCQNVAANRITDYVVDPQALLLQFAWEDAGDSLIAIYHSHPVDPAYPSASDAINAYYPDSVYLICSLLDDSRPVINGYWLREAPGAFDGAAARAALRFYQTRPGRWGYYVAPDSALPPPLSGLARPDGFALYVICEDEPGGGVYTRAVLVEPVAILVT